MRNEKETICCREREGENEREREKESIRDQPKKRAKRRAVLSIVAVDRISFLYTRQTRERTMEKVKHQCLDLFHDRIPN